MNKKRDLYTEQKDAVKKITALHRDLDSKLPKISNLFFIAVTSGFGENVNLKKLYPEMYARVESEMKGMIQSYAKAQRASKSKEGQWPSPIYQIVLKTDMKNIPKRKIKAAGAKTK